MEAARQPLPYTPRDRALERSLLCDFVIHGMALLSMAALLLPTLPGGSASTDLERIATIAAHPWRFRLGWLPWQLCAVVDLWMAIAMVRVRWLALVTEAVLRRARPFERYGRLAPWRHPGAELFARIADRAANSRLLGAILEPLPELVMKSEITDVVYVNYLVPADVAASMLPPGLEVQRLGPDGRHALFTFLTFRHGHFGFAFLGRRRKLRPSPVQTNWRVHARDPRTGYAGIYFLTNAVTHTAPAPPRDPDRSL